jgi:hypothetical protein
MPVVIRTNNHKRDVIDGWQLTAAERKDFDYLDWPAIQEGSDSASFVRYKGDLIDLNNMEGRCYFAEGWDIYASWSFSCGVLVRYNKDEFGHYDDTISVAYYYMTGD